MIKKVNITIDNKKLEVDSNITVLQAATDADINIPRLCFLKGISETSSCRICVVEDVGRNRLVNSCTYKVYEGLNILTTSPRVIKQIKINLELIAGNHQFDCWACSREHNCELLELLRRFNIDNHYNINKEIKKREWIVNKSESMVLDSSKCILCGRCIDACNHYTGLGILGFNNRGFMTSVGPAGGVNIGEAGCIYCGKCIQSCPTGALREKDDVDRAFDLLDEEGAYVVAQIAPSVRATLGEEFGYPMGTNVEGKIYHALEKLGFHDVVDVNFAADLTIMEEGTELIGRLKAFLDGDKDVKLPLFTSCSPGWIRYIERYAPEYLGHVSSCKSPQGMSGAIIKNYYAQKLGIEREKIKVVSIMPCIAKKYEASRPEMEVDGVRDIDLVLTTRELARFIKRHVIDFDMLTNKQLTSPLASYTGAGVIFGVTGGVMEAALRTIKALLEKEDAYLIDIREVRGFESIKEATLTIDGKELNFAVVHGAKHFKEVLELVKSGKKQYAFIEFMGCHGGCIFGGGQPITKAKDFEKIDVLKERAKALYRIDQSGKIRRSHENPHVLKLYEEFLGHPGSHLAHKLLHTTYSKKDVY
ncbi:MAG: NADP-reducing hydrogenase subunit HndC [Tenericutes bacterium ADurb.Bin024]|nr:MAG: NADP-reducing hydrogenase subunit HndC [Tenericutes bacterium ADurb.Bin024]